MTKFQLMFLCIINLLKKFFFFFKKVIYLVPFQTIIFEYSNCVVVTHLLHSIHAFPQATASA